MKIADVFKNNEQWVASKLAIKPDYFSELANGQSPELLYIGCSDSRVTAEDMMGAQPGECFVHRNVANMVVSIDLNMMSVLTYAVEHLKVKHIIVCGHYECGGVKAAMGDTDLATLNPWLQNISDVYRLHMTELNAIADEKQRYRRFVELNVQEQCFNVMKTAVVQDAYAARGISVHGWVFDIGSGQLIDLKIDFDQIISDLMPIYQFAQS